MTLRNQITVKALPQELFIYEAMVCFFVLLLLLAIPSIGYAGVTVFDESKGQDVDATLEGGDLERLQQLKIQAIPKTNNQPEVIKKEPTQLKESDSYADKNIKSPSDIVLLPWETETYDLGHAQFFVDGGNFSKELAAKILQIKNIEGLRTSFYLKAQKNFQEVVDFTRNGLLEMGSVEFKTDSRDRRFKRLGLKKHMSVYYTSPFGDSREFPIENPQYIINKINDVKRRVRNL